MGHLVETIRTPPIPALLAGRGITVIIGPCSGSTDPPIKSMTGTGTHNPDKRLGIAHRLIFSPYIEQLTTLASKEKWMEYMEHVWACICCHACLWTFGTEHGDVSPRNLLYDSENRQGKLIDHDSRAHHSPASSPGRATTSNALTGTLDFMAKALLTDWGEAALGVRRVYRHDLESFASVLLWTLVRYGKGDISIRIERRYLDGWVVVAYPTTFRGAHVRLKPEDLSTSNLPDEFYQAVYDFGTMMEDAESRWLELKDTIGPKPRTRLNEPKKKSEMVMLGSIEFVRKLATDERAHVLREKFGGRGHVQRIIQCLDQLQDTGPVTR
ncbi:hypothetical protein E1B28_005238 [Marasmius oreades]|uniref:Fungal-type protein kinase domain-containing protein n=1 Tax=Marasmius oreades TaxID=181124 RepID=A0A9P7V0A0_9AGAR|nr:uncharacterized protein E1B28_005238 [Marasmius oreades]KAG7097928.1 hypothetical protein E1B28_005238 [Marasmius oreades]